MENFTDISRIHSPVLYIFQGESMRIGMFTKDVLKNIKVFAGHGELFGLYTHSHGGVVHVTSLNNLNQRQLQDAMSTRIKATENGYSLSLIGEWFTIQNLNISPRELLQKKANTLNESETYFCIVVDKVQRRFDFEDISKFAQAFFLTKGKIYKMNMKILERESPFRLDTDFIEEISSAGYVGDLDEKCNSVENEENVGTELKELGISKLRNTPSNSKNPLVDNGNGLPVSENESEIKESKDTSVGNRTEESSDVIKAEPVLPTNETPIEEHLMGDDDAWVDIKVKDAAVQFTKLEEVPIQDEKTRIDHKKADSSDGKDERTGFDSSVAEKGSTFENEDNVDNKKNKDTNLQDGQVAKEERLSRDEDSTSTVLPDVGGKTMENKDEPDGLTEGQEEMNCSPAEHSSLTGVEKNTTKHGDELGTVDRGQGGTDSDDLVPGDKIENENSIIHNGPQQSEENGKRESEETKSKNGEEANEESLSSKESLPSKRPDEEKKITKNEDEIDSV